MLISRILTVGTLVAALTTSGLAARMTPTGAQALGGGAVADVASIGPGNVLSASELPQLNRVWQTGSSSQPQWPGTDLAYGPAPCPVSTFVDATDSVDTYYLPGPAAGLEKAESVILLTGSVPEADAAVSAWISNLRACMAKKPYPAGQGDYWLANLTSTTVDGVQVWSWNRGNRSYSTVEYVNAAFAVERDNVAYFVDVMTYSSVYSKSPVTPQSMAGTIAAVQQHLAAMS